MINHSCFFGLIWIYLNLYHYTHIYIYIQNCVLAPPTQNSGKSPHRRELQGDVTVQAELAVMKARAWKRAMAARCFVKRVGRVSLVFEYMIN
jgi:hypothetical protein